MSRREKARRARTLAFWQVKEAGAHNAAAKAVVEFDHCRADIAHLPEPERHAAYRELGAMVRRFRTGLRTGTSHPTAT